MCPQTSVGIVSSKRDPELVAEHRDAVAGMLVVPGVGISGVMRCVGLVMLVHRGHDAFSIIIRIALARMRT